MSDEAARPRALEPARLQKHLGSAVLLIGAVLLFLGLKDLHFARISLEDDSTPSIAPGSRVLVRTLEEDGGELMRGALYLVDLQGDAADPRSLRMARLVGLPCDGVERLPGRADGAAVLLVGGERLSLPAELAELFPSAVPEARCLVLTDNPACRHLDSRALGPLPVKRLKLRVVASLRSLLR